jgi:iron(III) transport system permease protein
MGVPFYKTFMKVTVPMCLPAILEVAMYYFVNAMVTVSAVIFLYTADFKLAAVSIVNMDDAGNLASAAAMSILIVATNIFVRVCYELIVKWMKNRKALKEEL